MTAPSYDFRGMQVLVTGAGRGIGLGIADAFAANGAEVSAVDLDFVSPPKAGVTQRNCDVTKPDEIRALVADIAAENGPIRTLVNNAGSDRRISFLEMSDDDWRSMLDVNLSHHQIFARAVAPSMAEAGGGAIVNLSSSAWMKMAENLAAYHAAKAGIVGLTRGMARDLGPSGIRVNAIAPGRVVTQRTDLTDDSWITETKNIQCLPSLVEVSDIAEAVKWLVSSGARMVTGQTIVVDGGVV